MIGDARGYVADLLLAGVPVPVFDYPPATVSPPAVLVVPDSPYLRQPTLRAGDLTVGLTVQVAVPAAAGPDAARSLDVLLEQVLAALADASVLVGELPAPRVDTATSQLLAELPVTVHWTE